MGCNCKTVNISLGIIIIIFAFWVTEWSTWLIAIAAALVIIHSLMCKKCTTGIAATSERPKSKPKLKKKK